MAEQGDKPRIGHQAVRESKDSMKRTLQRFNANNTLGQHLSTNSRGNHSKPVVHHAKNGGESGKISPDPGFNFERVQRRQKQNNSLLIPSDRVSKLINMS